MATVCQISNVLDSRRSKLHKGKPLKTDDDVNDYKRLILTRCGNIKDKEEFKVCCNKERLISKTLGLSEILSHFKWRQTQEVSCLPNACENGRIPWPGYPGECFKLNNKTESGCRLVKEGDQVGCA